MSNLKIFEEFRFKVDLKIAWIDMDVLGHVNSSKYFSYFESARIGYFENLGLLDYFKENQIAGVLSTNECSYLVPLHYPDLIIVGARVTEINTRRMVMEYILKSNSKGIAAFGETEILFFDFKQNRRIEIPDDIVQLINKFEN